MDVAPVNLLTIDILGIVTVKCMSYLLHVDVTGWVKKNSTRETLDSVQEKMWQLKASIENSFIVLNLMKCR